MREPCLHYPIALRVSIEPIEERPHLGVQSFRGWCLEMNTFFAHRPGDHLHRISAVISPGSDPNPPHAAASCREQGSMPREQPFRSERLIIVTRGVQHHFNNSLHVSIYGFKTANVHTDPARDRGADLLCVQLFALDFAAFEYVLREGAQHRFLPKLETQRFHASKQAALRVPDACQPP